MKLLLVATRKFKLSLIQRVTRESPENLTFRNPVPKKRVRRVDEDQRQEFAGLSQEGV